MSGRAGWFVTVVHVYTGKHNTVNSEIFARILFSRILALKVIFTTLKNRDYGMIYLYQKTDRMISPFREGYIFTNFTYAKFRENSTLAKISEFTVRTTPNTSTQP